MSDSIDWFYDFDAASEAAAMFGNIFPCRSRGGAAKTPHIKKWPARATNSTGQLVKWAKQFPGCLWGHPMTETELVVDLDGKTGISNFKTLTPNGKLPKTRTVRTRSGGLHHYFKLSEGHGVKLSASAVAANVDIRTVGGYTVVPPSAGYEMKRDIEAVNAPGWLLQLLQGGKANTGRGKGVPMGDARKTLADAVERIGKAKSGRNSLLAPQAYRVFLHVVSGSLTYEEVYDALDAAARASGMPDPGDPEEIKRALESGYAKAANEYIQDTKSVDLPEWMERVIYVKEQQRFYDPLDGTLITKESLDTTHDFVRVENAEGEATSVQPSTAFKRNPNRKIVAGLGWQPSPYDTKPPMIITTRKGEQERTDINLYTAPQWLEPNDDKMKVAPWLELTNHIIPHKKERRVVLSWQAHAVQHPEEKPGFQILWTGPQGLGKDSQMTPIALWAGNPWFKAVEMKDLRQGWGDHLHGVVLLFLSEVNEQGNRHAADFMKKWAAPNSDPYMTLNMKGRGMVRQRDALRIFATSNSAAPLSLDADDRRWFPIDSTGVKPWSEAEFKEYHDWVTRGEGCRAVPAYLAAMDLSKFSPHKMPFHPDAREALIESGHSRYVDMLAAMLRDRIEPFDKTVFEVVEVKQALEALAMGRSVDVRYLADEMRTAGLCRLRRRGERRKSGTVRTDRTKEGRSRTKVLYCKPEDFDRVNELSCGPLLDLFNKERRG